MAPAKTCLRGLKAVFTVMLLLSLTALPSISVAASIPQKKKILGSRPPGCVNKCANCRPCEATLVIPTHPKLIENRDQSHWEGNYYLLSWKCKCGDKLFHP